MLQNDNDRIEIKKQQMKNFMFSFFAWWFVGEKGGKERERERSKLNYMLYACIRLNYVEDSIVVENNVHIFLMNIHV